MVIRKAYHARRRKQAGEGYWGKIHESLVRKRRKRVPAVFKKTEGGNPVSMLNTAALERKRVRDKASNGKEPETASRGRRIGGETGNCYKNNF